ncbi:hypothetical protein [Archangium lansingense]|uniref:Uncharacterized protein n=1 Tax=Archangium lansingense TaxID=2995310 RepID=A0ABT3ZYD3_9BACT|nr:hypothetical protein [Archangium lansinium]MCY1074418.1 hypothetical protein [Archangium lansinium]
MLLLATRAWAQGTENAVGFLVDLAVGTLMFLVLGIVGVVTLMMNHREYRRPVPIILGLLVGMAKLGWGLRLAEQVFDRSGRNPNAYSGLVPGDYMMGVLCVVLLGMGGFELLLAVRAMVEPAEPLD